MNIRACARGGRDSMQETQWGLGECSGLNRCLKGLYRREGILKFCANTVQLDNEQKGSGGAAALTDSGGSSPSTAISGAVKIPTDSQLTPNPHRLTPKVIEGTSKWF